LITTQIKINKISHNTDRGVVFEINIRVVAAMPPDEKDNPNSDKGN
jgi:hypothetical protein